MTIQLNLYSTTYCHLCEEAESLLNLLLKQYEFTYTIIEIIEDIDLLTLYEIKIPVLKRLDNQTEICWPFTMNDIKNLLSQ